MEKPWMLLAAAVAFLSVIAWGAVDLYAADCREPVPAPKYKVGEKWTWRTEKGREWNNEVVQVEEGIPKLDGGMAAWHFTVRIGSSSK